jgi:hypothetical protein
MKNKTLFLLLPLLLSSCASTNINKVNHAINGEIDLSILPNIKLELLENHRFNSDISSALYGEYRTVIESSESNYYSELYFNNKLTSYLSHVKDTNGDLLEENLNIDNAVYTTNVVQDSVNVSYNSIHTTLFKNIEKIADSDLNKYFTSYKVSDGYQVILTSLGEGLLFSSFSNFFNTIDTYKWDNETLTYVYHDFVLSFSDSLDLSKIEFLRHKKDKYGGYREFYEIEVSDITDKIGLKPVESKMSESAKVNFETALKNFDDKLASGNFTHNINILGTPYNYSNFYDFTSHKEDFPDMMLSNLILDDASNGATYLGVVKENTGTYKPYGFSPYSDNYSSLTELKWDNVASLVPNLSKISSDFFSSGTTTLNGTKYKFDISNFPYFNFSFGERLLSSLYGGFDPVVIYGGFYVNYNVYNYTFRTLEINIDKNGNISTVLSFENEYGVTSSESSFKNFGTTDLENEATLKEGVDYIKDVYNGGN